MSANKGCHNCVHRFGWPRNSWQCSRTGFYTSVEMRFGGRCAEGTTGTELRLWMPREGLLIRAIKLIRINRADGQVAEPTKGEK